jgi:hypothetical protein
MFADDNQGEHLGQEQGETFDEAGLFAENVE